MVPSLREPLTVSLTYLSSTTGILSQQLELKSPVCQSLLFLDQLLIGGTTTGERTTAIIAAAATASETAQMLMQTNHSCALSLLIASILTHFFENIHLLSLIKEKV